jgi:MFS family permease
MIGLFLILPVFSLYAQDLTGATPLKVGLAIGIYGLGQALLQIPFGMLSDRIGRKPVIVFGLLLFAVGSVIAALADDINWIIVGRAIQGSGAISAAVMALAADLTRESQRTKAMAMIGATIGLSFALALIGGPLLGRWFGISGIFWVTFVTALLGMAILLIVVPTPRVQRFHRDTEPVPALLRRVVVDRQLLRLDWGIFSLHLMMTSLFLAFPLKLRDAGLAPEDHSWFYLPVLALSLLVMVPFIILAERHGRMKPVFLGAIAVLGLSVLGLYLGASGLWALGLLLWTFFTAVNLLEASLPSLVSKFAPADAKGSAMGVYSTSQFFGAFVGGAFGGWAHQAFGLQGVFLVSVMGAALWLIVAAGMRAPRQLSSELRGLGEVEGIQVDALTDQLLAVPGVVEAVVVPEDGVAYLKVDRKGLESSALDAVLAPEISPQTSPG